MATIIDSLADFFFSNLSSDRMQGLRIWTDQSASQKAFAGIGRNEFIRVQVAPQNIKFVQKSRISEQVIKDGKAFFFWRKDRFSSHLDLLELQISGVTRSLAREPRKILRNPLNVPTFEQVIDEGITVKQQEWLRFYRLTREPFIIEDRINHHNIQLETPALPIAVTFIGHFAAPVQWSHSSANPFLATWDLTLIVHRTEPDLEAVFQQISTVNITEET